MNNRVNLKKGILTIVFFVAGVVLFAQAKWVQQGADIDAQAIRDRFGTAVDISSDGLTVAIGAPNHTSSTYYVYAGNVRVYKFIAGVWVQQGADIEGEGRRQYSGRSLGLSADGLTVAIGSPENDNLNLNSGRVKVYKYIAGAWVQQGGNIDGEAVGDRSGAWKGLRISDDGLTVAIGARNNDGAGVDAGHVRVYKFIAGAWVQQGADIDGEAAGDLSAYSIDLSGDGLTVVIGAPKNDDGGTEAGQARVYKLIAGAWVQQGVDIDGQIAGEETGASVSLSADGLIVAVSSPSSLSLGLTNAGHVRVYKLIAGVWVQQGLRIVGEAARDHSGASVKLSADGLTVSISAPSNNDAGRGIYAGHVRVYKFIAGVWVQQGADIDGEGSYDFSGRSTGLSADGRTIIIGAPYNDSKGPNSNSGHARVYKLDTCIPSPPTTAIKTACESYTWIDGKTYTSSNTTATHKFKNKGGCDSVVTLNLTILSSQRTNSTVAVCEKSKFTFPSGKLINKVTVNASDIENLKDKNGCDSIHTTFLKVIPVTQSNHSFSVKEGKDIKILNGKFFKEVKQSFIDTFRTTSSKGCDSLVISTINVTEDKECYIFIPNTFTPNTDHINARFVVKAVCVKGFQAEIYDQGGKVIATSNDINNVWDGKDSFGNEMPINTYAYKMTFINKNNSRVVKFGAINLLR